MQDEPVCKDRKCKHCKYKQKFDYEHKEIKAVLESSADCILVLDRNYKHLYANQAAIDHVGTTRDKVIGKNIRDGLGHIPDFMHLWIRHIDRVFQTQKQMHVEDEVTINGRKVYSRSILSPVIDDNGNMFAVCIVYRDITEQKLVQKRLEESERRYRELYNNAHIALYRTRVSDGKLIDGNKRLAELLGYESLNRCLSEYYSTEFYSDPGRREHLIELLKENGKVENFEVKTQKIDGSPLWMKISAHLNHEEGYIEGTIRDITALKKLSKTENQILQLILQGKTNKETAEELSKSVRTIEDHRAHIMRKLDADNLVDLTKKTADL